MKYIFKRIYNNHRYKNHDSFNEPIEIGNVISATHFSHLQMLKYISLYVVKYRN